MKQRDVQTLSIAERMTDNQIAFAEALDDPEIETDREAYRVAYNNYTCSDEVASVEASKLKRHPKIVEYRQEQRNYKKMELLSNSKKRRSEIEAKLLLAMEVSPDTTPNSRLKAIELYAKMHNLFNTGEDDKAKLTRDKAIERLKQLVAENQNKSKVVEARIVKKEIDAEIVEEDG